MKAEPVPARPCEARAGLGRIPVKRPGWVGWFFRRACRGTGIKPKTTSNYY